MRTWHCELTSVNTDGDYTWRRLGADQPRGVISAALVPAGAVVGSHVRIETENSTGRIVVTACHLLPVEGEATTLSAHKPEDERLSLKPGQLHWANVLNPLEDPEAVGKKRPVVLVADQGTHWRVMGLTTKKTYADGSSRVAITNFHRVGLAEQGYLWGDKLTRITSESVMGYIGRADDALVESVVTLAMNDMSTLEIDDLRSVIRPSSDARHSSVLATGGGVRSVELTSIGLLSFLRANDAQVRADLHTYFGGSLYTGRHFETYSRHSNMHGFDGNDIAAVMSLSVQVAPGIPAALLELPTALFTEFSPHDRAVPIWRLVRGDLEPGSRFHNLHDALMAIPNIGSTIASKLLASKFPHSLPIWDRDVASLIGRPQSWWLTWYDAMRSLDLRTHLEKLRSDLPRQEVSLLRVADVALWMEAQRRKREHTL